MHRAILSYAYFIVNMLLFSILQGRKARLKATRSSTAAQNRYARGSPGSTYSAYSNSTSVNRMSNGASGVAGEEYSNGSFEEL